MTTRNGTTGAIALALAMATGAQAHVLDKVTDKDAFKLRSDVAKQVSKYTLCLVKAATKCEAKGAVSSPECDLTTGAVAYEPAPGKQTAKFQAAIAKCDEKQVLDKKGDDYAGIGCPGDCNDAAPGLQQCASLAAYEASLEGTGATAAKGQLGLLATLVDLGCASEGTPADEARIDCVEDAVKQLTKYASSVFKCQQKCETDATGKKGNGAPTNAGNCDIGPGSDPAFAACEAKAASKVTEPAAVGVSSVVGAVLNQVNDELFNREDATDPGSPNGTLSPCGTCGDDTRQGTEQCDGTDTGVCPGSCAADCTCLPVEDPILDGPPGSFCSTTVNPATTDYQPLCVPANGSGRHFRLEGAENLGNNGFVYLALGLPTPAPAGNPATTAGDGRFILTAGKSISCGNGWTYFRYSGVQHPTNDVLCGSPVFGDYNLGPQEVCADVSAGVPARVTFWATGANGANCKDKSTLTVATALYDKNDWAVAEAVNTTTHYFKISNTTLATATGVAVSSNTVLP